MKIDQDVTCYVNAGQLYSYGTADRLCPATAEQAAASEGQGDTAAGAIAVSLRDILLQADAVGLEWWRVRIEDNALRCRATGARLADCDLLGGLRKAEGAASMLRRYGDGFVLPIAVLLAWGGDE